MRAQFSFHGKGFERPKDWFGGSKLKSNPKSKRPLSTKYALHLVLRANASVLKKQSVFTAVDQTVASTCRKHGIRLYEYANVGNHLHLLIRLRAVSGWAAFIRELTGRLAQIASPNGCGRFWMCRPFTRIVRGWNRAYRTVKDYVWMNVLESEGLATRKMIRWAQAAFKNSQSFGDTT